MKLLQLLSILLPIGSMITSCQKSETMVQSDPALQLISDVSISRMPSSDFVSPENFVAGITNSYYPLEIGDTLFYATTVEEDGETFFETSYVAVTDEEKIIAGVNCTVVHDLVFIDGMLHEDTYDWFAQDIHGNVWYLGEDTKKFEEDGSYSTLGSFEHGVDGAEGGLFMIADLETHLGKSYKQENYPGIAEDRAKLISYTETVTIGLGTYTNCVKTFELSPLEPGFLNVKYYAAGIGQIYSEVAEGGVEFQELVEISE